MSFTLSDDGQISAIIKFSIKKNTRYTLDIEFLTCGNDNITYEQNVLYLNMFLIILNV
jgi:hypothetical protein